MVDYVIHAVLHFYRRCHHYEIQQSKGIWKPLPVLPKARFPIGVMGAGVLGELVATRLCDFAFPVRTWSRNPKQGSRYQSFAGPELLMAFVQQLRVVINLLPLTSATKGILNWRLFQELADGAYLINAAREAHLVEADLLTAIRKGKIDAARLDVFSTEPLPADHPFWSEPKIYLTPHVSADLNRTESVKQIVSKIVSMENQQPVNGIVNWDREY
jgi:glyoxylate/hydroxypyruvate reductase A